MVRFVPFVMSLVTLSVPAGAHVRLTRVGEQFYTAVSQAGGGGRS